MEDLKFLTWQLQIKTLGELAHFKKMLGARTNQELIDGLYKIYNSNQYKEVEK